VVKTEDQAKQSVLKYIEKLRKDIRISQVILFGSYAHNNPKGNSDIDLAIFTPDFSKDNPMKDLQFLSHATCGCDTSIEALAYRPEGYHN
jgi:predicted nucleotidyltransferase